jgi:hypothetical protein
MLQRNLTITRPDRDRLLTMTSAGADTVRRALCLAALRRDVDRAVS